MCLYNYLYIVVIHSYLGYFLKWATFVDKWYRPRPLRDPSALGDICGTNLEEAGQHIVVNKNKKKKKMHAQALKCAPTGGA